MDPRRLFRGGRGTNRWVTGRFGLDRGTPRLSRIPSPGKRPTGCLEGVATGHPLRLVKGAETSRLLSRVGGEEHRLGGSQPILLSPQ